MPVAEKGYERQVAPNAAAAMPLARPAGYGAGLGAELAQAGQSLHATELRAYKIERQQAADAEAADFAHRFALARENLDSIAREARDNAEPGARGHAEKMAEALRIQRETLLEGITEDNVRRAASQQVDEFALRFRAREADFESGKRIDRLVEDTQRTTEISANRARRLSDPGDYAGELKLGYAAIDAMGVLDDVKQKLRDNFGQQVTVAYVNGLNDRDPQAAVALIDAGAFDDVLSPQQLDALRSGSMVEIRRAEAAAEQEANAAKAALREQIATLEEADRQGIDVSDKLPEAIAAAAALGDSSTALKLEGIAANSQFAKVYEGQTPVQRERRATELGRKRNPSKDEQRELAWLESHRGALDERFNADPVGWSVTNAPAANKPPPLDLAEPGSIQARVAWANKMRDVYGRPVPVLSKNEAQALAAQKAEGRAGELAVMDQLAQLPAGQASVAARMVDPDDARFAHMVALPPIYRGYARDGAEALRADKKLTAPPEDRDKDTFARQDQQFDVALRAVDPALRNAIIESADQIAAGLLKRHGGTMTPTLRWRALNMALGSYGNGADKRGGIADWNGSPFLLPDGMTSKTFAERAFAAAGRNGPANPDGSRADLRRAAPAMVGPGIYEFRTAGGRTVLGADGKPWQFNAGAAR